MLPIWDIAKLINPTKATQIKAEFDRRIDANGIMLKGVDADYAKRTSTTISTGQIMKSSPNTTVTRENGDGEMWSSHPVKWTLTLTFEPAKMGTTTITSTTVWVPSTDKTCKAVKLTYVYTVEETGGDKTKFRMDGHTGFDVLNTFVNMGKKVVELNGEMSTSRTDWYLDRTNQTDEIVRQLKLMTDGTGKDDSGNIGFDAVLNFFYVKP